MYVIFNVLGGSLFSKALCGWGDYSWQYHLATFFGIWICSDFYEFLYHRLGHVDFRFWHQHKHHHVFYNPSPFSVIGKHFSITIDRYAYKDHNNKYGFDLGFIWNFIFSWWMGRPIHAVLTSLSNPYVDSSEYGYAVSTVWNDVLCIWCVFALGIRTS